MNTEITSGSKCLGSKERVLQNALHCGLNNPSSNGMKAFAMLSAKLYKAQKGSEPILVFGWREWLIVSKFLEWDEDLHCYMFGSYQCVCNEYK